MTDWVPLLLTGLGAGVIGSVITTYGSQARERRGARKEALARLAEADRAAGTAALLAGVPLHVVD